jgi:hypothetical protein
MPGSVASGTPYITHELLHFSLYSVVDLENGLIREKTCS